MKEQIYYNISNPETNQIIALGVSENIMQKLVIPGIVAAIIFTPIEVFAATFATNVEHFERGEYLFKDQEKIDYRSNTNNALGEKNLKTD